MGKFSIDLNKLLVSQQNSKFFWQDKLSSWLVKTALILIALQFLFLVVIWKFVPPQIPIFYNRPWGLEQLADKKIIFIIPFSLLILLGINFYIANILFVKEKLLAKILLATNFLAVILFLIAITEIFLITTV